MIPLPQLLDGLSRGRTEVLQNALAAHKKAFRSEFVRYLTGGMTTFAEEHVARMAVLFETILNHLKKCDKLSPFAYSVLNLTIEHINEVILELEVIKLAANSISIQQKNAVLELLHFNLNILKTLSEEEFVHHQSLPAKVQVGPVGHIYKSPTSSSLLTSISSKTDEEVVQHALLSYDSLVCAKELLLSRRQQSASQVNEFVQDVADAYIKELLMKKQIDVAKDVIYNTNRDVWQTLKNICLDTVDSTLRDYLAFELNSIGLLEPSEIDVWKFLILIEGVIKGTNIAVRISGRGFQMDSVCSEERQMEVSLSALLNLPSLPSARTPLLIELYFKTSNGTLEPMLDKVECWNYLLQNNQVDRLIRWVNAANSNNGELEQLDRLTTFLSVWSLTQDMIDDIPKYAFSVLTQETVLDYLSKYGLYTSGESQNIQKILLRAIRTSQIFDLSNQTIVEVFVNFCLDNSIPDLLVSCDITTDRQTSLLLNFYTKHKTLKDKPLSKSALLDCIKYCSNYLNLPENEQWISLACLLLADKTLEETLNHQIPTVEDHGEQKTRDILSQYPTLEFLLKPREKKICSKDLSLLSLLRQRFSSSSNNFILKQQSLSSMFKEESEVSEIDFSHEPTIILYGHKETLDFKYYIKQGRPCHASMLVLSDAIKTFKRPSHKLIKRAVLSAHELAYQYAKNQMITGACIAFIEMLGASSSTLRTNLATIKEISSFLDNDKSDSSSNELQFLFMSDGKPIHPAEIYEFLQSSLPLDLYMQGLAVHFSALHKLPPPRKFLKYCGEKNDWMNFLLFCQIHNYPLETVKASVKYFQSNALKDHLSSFLIRSLKVTSDSTRQRKQSGPGLKELEQLSSTPIPPIVLNSCVRDSLFGVLLAAHNCSDPGEALLHMCVELPCPVLAVLADFYQVNAEAQLVAWLASWFPKEERVNYECWPKSEPWPADMVELVILRSLDISCSNLLTGFQIFMPEHPLVLVIEVLDGLFRQISPNETQHEKSLLSFKESCSTFESRNDQWSLSNSNFFLDIGIKVLIRSLECIPLIPNKICLLELISSPNISLLPEGFDCLKLLAIFKILEPLEVDIDVKHYIRDSAAEIKKCTEKLISFQYYEEAATLNENTFIVEEQTSKFQILMNSKYPDLRGFFRDCCSSFEQYNIEPYAAFNFFQTCSLHLKKNEDKWRAMYYAVKWLRRSVLTSPHLDRSDLIIKIEREMWQCCFCENNKIVFNVLAEELHNSCSSTLCTKELARSFKFSDEFHNCSGTCTTLQCPNELLNCLLDIGDIVSASCVQNFFQSNHQDFEILESCINLAEEKISEDDIPSNWAKHLGLSLIDYQPEVIEAAPAIEENYKLDYNGSSVKKNKIISVIETLCKKLQHGKEIGKQIVSCYRLAINLGLSYNEIIDVKDPLKLLRIATFKNNSGVFSIVADIMVALKMSSEDRLKFLSREIIAAISKGPAPGSAKVFILWGHDLEHCFRHVVELAPDPSLLGNELMIMVSKLSILEKHTPKAVLNSAVELLVRAHDCYAAACHMEGISHVLRTVSGFAPVLKSRTEWSLMVRLLTGIERYTEMNYIFKILKENDHFEFLLRKDFVKTLSFKLALLDWLRRECPNDTALLKMTAAHFAMHEQEANLWQKDGNNCLDDVVHSGIQNNLKTKQGLQTAMQDFSHAAECYLQADMLNHAMTCANQAELIALQIYLLSATSDGNPLRVIKLDSKSIAKLIISTLGFNQALIVARAYNHRADWSAALFYHCVSPGLSCKEYFTAWSSCMELTPLIIQSIAYRLQRTTAITREMTVNMKWLLGHVKDIDVRYKIASELGLKDMVESLLNAPEVAYLKDTVWQKGFKR